MIKCKGYKYWTDCGFEYDCEYEFSGDITCDDCIIVLQREGQEGGKDPRTGKEYVEVAS